MATSAPDGRVYYFHAATRETSWTRPTRRPDRQRAPDTAPSAPAPGTAPIGAAAPAAAPSMHVPGTAPSTNVPGTALPPPSPTSSDDDAYLTATSVLATGRTAASGAAGSRTPSTAQALKLKLTSDVNLGDGTATSLTAGKVAVRVRYREDRRAFA